MSRRFWANESLYFLLLAVTVTLLRSPTWTMGQTNLDEAQWLAGTITLDREFAFWGRVDTMTSGPLIVHFLWLWTLVAGEHTFQSTKLLTTLIWVLVTWFTYCSLRQTCGRRASRYLVTPFAATVGLMRLNDYVGYNGEQLPILLLSACLFFIFRAFAGKPIGHVGWAILGMMLGAIPYTKLQATPIGMLVGCWALMLLWKDRKTLTLVSAVVSIHVVVWYTLWLDGQMQDYWTRCILQSVDYTQNWSSIPFIKRFYVFPISWMRVAEARWFIVACGLVVFATSVLRSWRSPSFWQSMNPLMLGTIGYVLISVYCVTQPGNFFDHYHLLMVHPVFLCAAAFVSSYSLTTPRAAAQVVNKPERYLLPAACTLLLIAATVPGVIAARSTRVRGEMLATLEGKLPATELIQRISTPNTALSIWGWNPRPHVDLQIPQATSESLTYHQIAPSSRQEYYLAQYVAELSEHQDLVFIDITGEGGSYMFTGDEHDHRRFKSVKRLVDERLEYIETVEGARVYRTKATTER